MGRAEQLPGLDDDAEWVEGWVRSGLLSREEAEGVLSMLREITIAHISGEISDHCAQTIIRMLAEKYSNPRRGTAS